MSYQDPITDGGELSPPQIPQERTKQTLGQVTRNVTIQNSLGLHMRPVMQFVDLSNQFQARILVKKGSHAVDGKNPMELMLLEAVRETELEIQANGEDAAQAIDALTELIRNGFGEE